MIIQIPHILNTQELAHCRHVLEKSSWVDGALGVGEPAKRVKFNLQIPQTSDEAKELGELVLNALGRSPTFNSVAMPLHVYPPSFNRYDMGMRYGDHVDGVFRTSPFGGGRLRQDVSTTIFF